MGEPVERGLVFFEQSGGSLAHLILFPEDKVRICINHLLAVQVLELYVGCDRIWSDEARPVLRSKVITPERTSLTVPFNTASAPVGFGVIRNFVRSMNSCVMAAAKIGRAHV